MGEALQKEVKPDQKETDQMVKKQKEGIKKLSGVTAASDLDREKLTNEGVHPLVAEHFGLDETSKAKALAYLGKAPRDAAQHVYTGKDSQNWAGHHMRAGDYKSADAHLATSKKELGKSVKRLAGIDRALKIVAKEEVDLTESIHAAAKELADYAAKHGGMDKKDFHTAAKHMQTGNHSALQQHIKGLDSEPRDKILTVLNKHGVDIKHYGYAMRESWDHGAYSGEAAQGHHVDALRLEREAAGHKKDAKEYDRADPSHHEAMARFHNTMARSVKSSFHAGEYGTKADAKKASDAHLKAAADHTAKAKDILGEEVDVWSVKNMKTGQVYHSSSKYPITKNSPSFKKIKAAGGDHIHAALYKNGKLVEEETISELKLTTMQSYADKAHQQAMDATYDAAHLNRPGEEKLKANAKALASKRAGGVQLAQTKMDKMAEEEIYYTSMELFLEALMSPEVKQRVVGHEKAGNKVTDHTSRMKNGEMEYSFVVTQPSGKRSRHIYHGNKTKHETMSPAPRSKEAHETGEDDEDK